ncbi:hypothetical protein [Sporosarcina sp. HYO08]|nr:hypothetical protein [Sporosarcina sp. HYO08]
MMLMPVEALQQFDNAIYYHKIVGFLERDWKTFEDGRIRIKSC